ncbi:ABC transporter ATP-binding protein [Actibacterium sp. 188UL27-1]|uniref:ABC transporter ATP-binding protein n=1 Tax=Actibacterium sp. 188UL27-1 TaxID=2786961 RepID=UPI001956189F|nr:dipeptide/oligopeptide/nickel ABC transporter ATP-binding protein [Actibacterium sp. 188UL27-1]MBM7068819.1 ABC transporter ATP-binding protein [Actibacterium sp. 188UL27-1]
MLSVDNLTVRTQGKTLVQGVSLTVQPGQMLCIIGESGAGKSTVIKALQGLMPGTCDHFRFDPIGLDLKGALPDMVGLPNTRWVMQDPLAALDPRFRLGRSVAESLHRLNLPVDERLSRVKSALETVELGPEFADRFPTEVSMGQAQRACLARAMIAEPRLIFFDEPLSALDALVQKKIARRMDELRRQTGMAYVVVTHDLGFAATYADHIILLRQGHMEASQTREAFFIRPANAYARALIDAARNLGALPESQVA